jgi:hypothetical protein
LILYCGKYIYISNNTFSFEEFNEVLDELFKVKIFQEYENSQYNSTTARLSGLALFHCQRINHMVYTDNVFKD